MTGPTLHHDPEGARARRARRIAYAFAFGMAAVNVLVQLVFINKVGRADWDQFVTLHLIQQWNHHYFGLAKHWNPLMGGGMSLGGDPQVPVLSLSMLIAYLLGPVTGIRVSVMLWSSFGFVGAYLFSGLFFHEKPLRWLAGFYKLRNFEGHCIFFGAASKICLIYKIRPQGCRFYPLVYDYDDKTCVFDSDCPRTRLFYQNELKFKKTCKKLRTFLKLQLYVDI